MSENNQKLRSFIETSRELGLSDEEILEEALESGWRRSSVILALHEVSLPAPDAPVTHEDEAIVSSAAGSVSSPSALERVEPSTTVVSVPEPTGERKIGVLLTVLHSVAVWVYLVSAVPAIGVSIFSLLTGNGDSSFSSFVVAIIIASTLLLAVTQVALIVTLGKNREIVASKVFNILTIAATVLSLVGIITTLIIVLLTTNDHILEWVCSLAVLAGIEVVFLLQSYNLAFNKSGSKHSLLIPILTLALVSVLGLGLTINNVAISAQAKIDTETSRAMASVASKIAAEARENGALPGSIQSDEVTYRKTSVSTYDLCANFLLDTTYDSGYYDSAPIRDDYVSEYDFSTHRSGEQCFSLENAYLTDHPYKIY